MVEGQLVAIFLNQLSLVGNGSHKYVDAVSFLFAYKYKIPAIPPASFTIQPLVLFNEALGSLRLPFLRYS